MRFLIKPTLALSTACLLACTSTSPTKDEAHGSYASPLVVDTSCFKNATDEVREKEVERLLALLTLEEKSRLVRGSGKFHVAAIERLGIHELNLSDGPHGVRHEMARFSFDNANMDNDQATYLPPTTMLAATWNRHLGALHGSVLGAEARERGKDIILGPGVNLARLPTNGRNFEYLGEDPYLASAMAVEAIKAIQANDVAANIKHYALNTQEWHRDSVSSEPGERALREVYLRMFEAAVKEANVYSVMGAYNAYKGTNANQSKELIDILKNEWGFDGVLLTDWNVDINTRDAAMHGLDLEMGTDVPDYEDYFFAKPLIEAIQNGSIPESVLDEKVRRILRLHLRIGMMDVCRLSGQRNTRSHQQAAYDIAKEGVVLLKNSKDLLPMSLDNRPSILVLGVNADKQHASGGGSSQIKALYEITPLEGLREKLHGKADIQYMQISGGTIAPIDGNNVISRHWTGTPAWTLSRYATTNRAKKLNDISVPDSTYQVVQADPSKPVSEFVTMTARIKPQVSGQYVFKANLLGTLKLKVDGRVVMSEASQQAKTISRPFALDSDKIYEFELQYDGSQFFTFGWDAPNANFASERDYIEAAKKADIVLYYGGLSHNDDRESIDRPNMKLPYGQDRVIQNLLAANANTVVFLIGGSPVEMPWIDQAHTLVWGWYGGMEGGRVYADVLFGDVNPSGKLPFVFPKKLADSAAIALNDYHKDVTRYPEGIFIGQRWFEKQNIAPLFAFGHGLSYTNFAYSDIKLSTKDMRAGSELTVTARVTNTGKVAGAEVVQLYLSDKEASVERPIKELKGFDKVQLAPGESKRVTMTLTQRDLSFWDVDADKWVAEAGDFEVLLGASAADIRLKAEFSYRP